MRNLNTILTLGFATTAVTTTLQDKGSPLEDMLMVSVTLHTSVCFLL